MVQSRHLGVGNMRFGEILRRGWKRRCPRCGEGPIFVKGIEFHDRCPACSLLLQRDHGDIWMFLIITDRIPILFGIAAVYFGYRSTSMLAAFAFFLVLSGPILATLRQRLGVALALEYISRVYLPDPSDEIHGGQE